VTPGSLRASSRGLAFFATVAVAVSTAACGGGMGPSATAGDADHALVGAQAPAFELADQIGDKHTVSLSDGSGKVTIVDFWATWCEPCKDSFPHYQKMVDEFGGKLVVIGISVDEDPSGIPDFAKKTGVSFPLLWDDGQALSSEYHPPTMPTSYILDKNGIVRFVHAGFHSGDEAKIEAHVKELMQ